MSSMILILLLYINQSMIIALSI